MKPYLPLIAGLLLFAPDARAQVIINQAALDQLAGIAPPVISAPEAIRQPPPKAAYRHVPRRHSSAVAHIMAASVAPKTVVPRPAAPQPSVTAVVAKPAALPPIAAKAPRLLPVVIDFAAGSADLPGNGAAALRPICAHANGVITIDAYAVADPSDPSSPARLSMSRAFAIRDALSACGIPAGNIIPRANGAAKTNNPDAAEVSPSP